jgi:superfamily II DNA/RNA helicase
VTIDELGQEKITLSDPSCKVDALMDDIKNGDYEGDSVAVCAVSRQLIELLSARLTKEGIAHGLITGAQTEDERQKSIDDFQSGKTKWILFTAAAGGVGVAARIYESAPIRNLLIKIPQTISGSPEEAALLKRLTSTIQQQQQAQSTQENQ